MERSEIKLGDRVTWKSQAGGHWSRKYGTIIYKGEPSLSLNRVVEDTANWLDEASRNMVNTASNNQRRFDGGGQGILVAVDYLEKLSGLEKLSDPVEVKRFNKQRIYAPRASQLEKTEKTQ